MALIQNEYPFLALQTFNEILNTYLLTLKEKSRSKALITESMAEEYLQILSNPQNTSIGTPETRHWIKSNFSYQSIGGVPILLRQEKPPDNWKPVALKERLYYIIAEEHLAIGHGGTKATYKQVASKYYGVKRYLTDSFVEKCKTCQTRRVSIRPLGIKPIISKFFLHRVQVGKSINILN